MKKKKPRIRKPVMKWQTGEFSRNQTIKFELPTPFLMLCKLVDVTPEMVINDFMENLSFSSWRREGKCKAREALSDYFIEAGYGGESYPPDKLKTMFREMDAMGILFPKDGDPGILDAYAEWRKLHQDYWFNKWSIKPRE